MIKNLLVPLDGTDLGERAMRESIALARQFGASIVGFVAEPELPLPVESTNMVRYGQEIDAHAVRSDTHAHDLLAQFGALVAQAGVAFSGRHRCTDRVDEAIARAAEEIDDAMIVMITHGRGAFGGLLFGSHTKGVMSLTKVPLLVLH